MTVPAERQSGSRLSPGGVIVLAGAVGWVSGAVEALIAIGRHLVAGRLSLFGAELIWMAPLAAAAVFLLFGAVYGALGLAIPWLRRSDVALTALGGLGAFSALSAITELHWAAALVLGAGLGRAAARAFAGPVGRGAVGGRVLLAGTLLSALSAGGQLAVDWRRERREAAGKASADHPNVLLLVLDTVRAWNLGWHGYQRATTPRLETRWRSGVVFDRALATAPWTLPSHASMFTGEPPTSLSAGWDRPLDGERVTLAEALGRAGYATGGFVGNYRYAGASTGLDRGFGRYRDYPWTAGEAIRMLGLSRKILRIPRVQQWLGEHRFLEATTAAEINRDFLGWVDRHRDRPYFAFLNYVDAHSPYLPPAPFDSVWTRTDSRQIARRYAAGVERVFGRGPIPGPLIEEYLDGYDGAISYLDLQIDSLLVELNRRGRLENTIVIVTADHGEHFGEHRLIQHGNSLFLPLLHVPLVIWAPGRVPRGVRIGAPVSLVNLAATVMDLAGVADSAIPGRSLARFWRDSAAARDTAAGAVDWHRSLSPFPPSPLLLGSLRSVVLDSLHYIRRSDGGEELYLPGRDFLEVRNLIGSPEYADAVVAARAALRRAFGDSGGPPAAR